MLNTTNGVIPVLDTGIQPCRNSIKNVVFYITLLCLPTQCPIKIPGSQCQALG
ncbi:hypothetical protein [Wolbachia endosymbiont (group A) of Anomoia purmunda]|uniref:hypothetical protein n=1 Tax=Wolbachia endosymbiont (group A) of Anomoia purmunda TaxID=2953978 RepID=UPI00222E4278|nr:hypothetical protein [Wolbachia endosymbiont (group A) of Anomoia purmunda]